MIRRHLTEAAFPLALLLGATASHAHSSAPGDPVEVWRVPLSAYTVHSTLDSRGNLLLAGGSYTALKLAPDGTELWSRSFDLPGSREIPVWIATDADDNVILGGYAEGSSGGVSGLLAVKYDPAGNLLWHALGSNRGQARRLSVDEFGDVYLFGEVWGGLSGLEPTGNDFLTVKIDAQGVPQWARVAHGTGSDEPYAMDVRDGLVVVTGQASSPFMTVCYDYAGSQLWQRFYTDGIVGAFDVVVGPAGQVVVCGWGTTYGTYPYTGTVVQYDAAGNERWRVLHNGPGGALDNLRRLAIDDTGAVAAVGFRDGDWVTWKIDATGSLLWAESYDGTSQPFAEAASVPAIGASGQVYVVGKGGPSCAGFGLEGHVLRYAPDGGLDWSYPLECSTFPHSVELGARGDLWIGATREAFRLRERRPRAQRPPTGLRLPDTVLPAR